MHVEETRLIVQPMVVQRHDFYAVLPQRADHGVYLLGGHHEVAIDRRLALSGRLEVDGGCHTHWSVQARAVFGGYLLSATDVVLVDAALRFAGVPDNVVELVSVEAQVLRRPAARF